MDNVYIYIHIAFLCDIQWERWRKLDANRRAHPQCFKCTLCNHQISGKYHEKHNGEFLCLDNGCVKKVFGDKTKIVSYNEKQKDPNMKYVDQRYCFVCQTKLSGSYMADSDNNKYHKDCFQCNECQKSLVNDPGFARDGKGKLWCKSCRIQMKTKEIMQLNAQKNNSPFGYNQQQSYNRSPFGKPQ